MLAALAGCSGGSDDRTAAIHQVSEPLVNGAACLSRADCDSGYCDNTGHCAACTADGNCIEGTIGTTGGQYCSSAGVCTARKADGQSCAASNQCSGTSCYQARQCVNGCCDNLNVCHGYATGDKACSSGRKCDDGNPCHTGGTVNTTPNPHTCTGTTNLANASSCNPDTTTCTVDQCSAGVCTHPAGNAGVTCRNSAGVCDPAETCSGSSTSCPADVKSPSGTACADDGNACTLDQCNGSSASCQHTAGNAGAVCRAANGTCDVAETCTGTSATCPVDAVASSTTVCRASQGECDPAESCPGLRAYAQTVQVDNTASGALSNFQVIIRVPTSNALFSHLASAAGNDLRVTLADDVTSVPYWIENVDPAAAEGRIWVKIGSLPQVAPPGHSATLHLHYGDSTFAASPQSNLGAVMEFGDEFNGTSLDTASKWTLESGSVTVGSGLLTMTSSGTRVVSKTYLVNARNGQAFRIETRFKNSVFGSNGYTPNGLRMTELHSHGEDFFVTSATVYHVRDDITDNTRTYADSFTNWTLNSIAIYGTSNGSANVTTYPWAAGPASAAKSFFQSSSYHQDSNDPNGDQIFLGRNDNDPSAQTINASWDWLIVRKYATTEPVATIMNDEGPDTASKSCPPDATAAAGAACSSDNNTCTNDVCNGSGACTHPANTGTTCDDGNACTSSDVCRSDGTCAGGILCGSPPSECYESPGACTAGACTYAPKSAGTPCTPDSNSCTLDQCDGAGSCTHPTTGDGTACNDGNGCTQTDTCAGGVCVGSNPVVCTALNECQEPGTCDPSTGACSTPAKADGTPCDDANACSGPDSCRAGVCVGAGPVACCFDRIRNGTESDIDCGGSCFACALGQKCAADADCATGHCIGGICSTCGDGIQNGGESDVDCGGLCAPCAVGQHCTQDFHCQTGNCVGGACGVVPCGNALGIQTPFAAAMWGVCPTRVRYSEWSASQTLPTQPNWSFATGLAINSSPAIGIDGAIYFGSADHHLYALNVDGTKKWDFATGGAVDSSPAIGFDGTIYFGSFDNKVYALAPEGTQKWSYDTGGDVESSPLIGPDATIYVGAEPLGGGKLFALVGASGTLKWSTSVGSLSVDASAALSQDAQTVYIGSGSNDLWALRAKDGSVKWRFATGGDVDSTPAVDLDGTIVFGSDDDRVYAVRDDGDHATELWRFTTGGDVNSSPALRAGTEVVVGSNDGILYALKTQPGLSDSDRVLWRVQTGGAIRSAPTIGSDASVVFTSDDGKLRLVDASGVVAWSFDLGAASQSSPAITDLGNVIVGSDASQLVSVGVAALRPTDLSVSGPITATSPSVTVNVALEITDLPSSPLCVSHACQYTLGYNALVSERNGGYIVRKLSGEMPVTVPGPITFSFSWDGLRDDQPGVRAPDGVYRVDVQTVLRRTVFVADQPFTSTLSRLGDLPCPPFCSSLGGTVVFVCAVNACSDTPVTPQTSPLCDPLSGDVSDVDSINFIKNTDLGFPTTERRTTTPIVHFLFGDVPDDNFWVRVDSQPALFLKKVSPQFAPDGSALPLGDNDAFATWTNVTLPAPGACSGNLKFPTDSAGLALPQTFNEPWQLGKMNFLGDFAVMGAAFSVASSPVLFATTVKEWAPPDGPLGGTISCVPCSERNDPTCVDPCITEFTPDDRCLIPASCDPSVDLFQCTVGLCMIGVDGGSCNDPAAPAVPNALCVPRSRGRTLVASFAPVQDWVSADISVARQEAQTAFSGTEKLISDLVPIAGWPHAADKIGLGGPFTNPTFLVEEFKGVQGVWVYGRPTLAGFPGTPSSAEYLMRIDVEAGGKLGVPRYFTGVCENDTGGEVLCAGPGVQPKLSENVADNFRLFTEENVAIVWDGSVTALEGLGPNGGPLYVMMYGGRFPPNLNIGFDADGDPSTDLTRNVFFPSVTQKVIADPLTGFYLRTAPTPWGPWSSAQLVYSALSPNFRGYCELLHFEDNNQSINNSYFGLSAGEDATTFCQERAVQRGLPGDVFVAKNAALGQVANDGAEYGIGIIEPLTETGMTITGIPMATVYWTMSTWVPYRVVLMQTTIQKEQPPSVQPLPFSRYIQFSFNKLLINSCLTTPCCVATCCLTGFCGAALPPQ